MIKTPLQLLRHMRSLLGPNIIPNNILRRMWMDKLSTTTTQILAPMTEDGHLKKLADVTNRIHTTENNRLMYSLSNDRQNDQEVSQIKKAISEQTIQMR